MRDSFLVGSANLSPVRLKRDQFRIENKQQVEWFIACSVARVAGISRRFRRFDVQFFSSWRGCRFPHPIVRGASARQARDAGAIYFGRSLGTGNRRDYRASLALRALPGEASRNSCSRGGIKGSVTFVQPRERVWYDQPWRLSADCRRRKRSGSCWQLSFTLVRDPCIS